MRDPRFSYGAAPTKFGTEITMRPTWEDSEINNKRHLHQLQLTYMLHADLEHHAKRCELRDTKKRTHWRFRGRNRQSPFS